MVHVLVSAVGNSKKKLKPKMMPKYKRKNIIF